MQLRREIGRSGLTASAVGLGTWAMGGWMWGGGDDMTSVAAIRTSLDQGITLIDTAPAYGLGRAERLVGRAIDGRRNEVVLVTKCDLVWNTDSGRPFVMQDGKTIHRFLGAASVRAELEASLRRLRTDYVDVYIAHWQDPTTPIAETMGALLALKAEGKIRAIGVSNASAGDVKEYLRYGPVDCAQEAYNMLDRRIETTLVPLCLAHHVSILSYSSLALGLLTGKIGPDRRFAGDDQRASNPRFSSVNRARVAAFATDVVAIAQRCNVEVGQIVTAWTLSQPGIDFALCGARTVDQAAENAAAGAVRLNAEELARIDQAIACHLASVAEVG